MRLIVDYSERLDRFLARSLPEHSRTKLAKMANEGVVLVDGNPQKASFDLRPGSTVELSDPEQAPAHDLTPADIPIEVLFEDEHLLVVNKPRGLAVHPASTLKEPSLVNALLARKYNLSKAGGDFRPGIVHRLDKETTGLLIVAKTDVDHVKLAKEIESKATVRRYVAVVPGTVLHNRFTIAAPIARSKRNRILMAVDPQGREAVTHVKTLATVDAGTVLAAALETGRTHQIRVHLQSIGHPILGDRLYAPKRYQDLPLQLHAAYLEFTHPGSNERVSVYADPPTDFVGYDAVSQAKLEPF